MRVLILIALFSSVLLAAPSMSDTSLPGMVKFYPDSFDNWDGWQLPSNVRNAYSTIKFTTTDTMLYMQGGGGGGITGAPIAIYRNEIFDTSIAYTYYSMVKLSGLLTDTFSIVWGPTKCVSGGAIGIYTYPVSFWLKNCTQVHKVAPKRRIVVIGASTSIGWNAEFQTQSICMRMRFGMAPKYRVTEFGAGGMALTTIAYTNQKRQDYADSIAMLCDGTESNIVWLMHLDYNDWSGTGGWDSAAYKTGYSDFLKKLKKSTKGNTQFFVQSMYLISTDTVGSLSKGTLWAYARAESLACIGQYRTTYINGRYRTPMILSYDGAHGTSAGYAMEYDTISNIINKSTKIISATYGNTSGSSIIRGEYLGTSPIIKISGFPTEIISATDTMVHFNTYKHNKNYKDIFINSGTQIDSLDSVNISNIPSTCDCAP